MEVTRLKGCESSGLGFMAFCLKCHPGPCCGSMPPWMPSLNALIAEVSGIRAMARREEGWGSMGGPPEDGPNAQLPQKGIRTQTAISLCPGVRDALAPGDDCAQVGEDEEPGTGPHKTEQKWRAGWKGSGFLLSIKSENSKTGRWQGPYRISLGHRARPYLRWLVL